MWYHEGRKEHKHQKMQDTRKIIPPAHSAKVYLFFFVFCLLIPSASAAELGLLIDQETNSLVKITVYYSPNAIRLDIDRSKSILVMRAPERKVHLFQPVKHLIYEVEADKFGGQIGTPDMQLWFPHLGLI